MNRLHTLLRPVAVLALFIFAVTAIAQETPPPPENRAFLTDHVSFVDQRAMIIGLRGGALRLDVSGAALKMWQQNAAGQWNLIDIGLNQFTPGAQIAANIVGGNYPDGSPLTASMVQLHIVPFGDFGGEVTAVDPGSGTFRLAGQTIQVESDTIYGGRTPDTDINNLEELHPGMRVSVDLKGYPNRLVAHRIFVASGEVGQPVIFRAIRLRVVDDTWFVKGGRINNQEAIESFKVVSLTSIEPLINDYDHIQVFGEIIDGVVVAFQVEKVQTPCPNIPFPIIDFTGVMTERTATTITIDMGDHQITGKITEATLDNGLAQVGDHTELVVERHGNNDYWIREVRKVDGPIRFYLVGPLTAIDGNTWTIAGRRVTVTADTRIFGEPKIGDVVRTILNRAPGGELIAEHIQKEP